MQLVSRCFLIPALLVLAAGALQQACAQDYAPGVIYVPFDETIPLFEGIADCDPWEGCSQPEMGDFDTDLFCTTGICLGSKTRPVRLPPRKAGQAVAVADANYPYDDGGTSDPMSFPYVVALLRNGDVHCSGFIVGQSSVVTAAHCVCPEIADTVFIGSSIYEGDSDSKGYEEEFALSGEFETFSRDFCHYSNPIANGLVDLAIVYTEKPMELPRSFFPWLPLGVYRDQGTSIVVGFGASEYTSAGGVKRFAVIEVFPCDVHPQTGCLRNKEMVAVNPPGERVDTCKGDSGGPVLYDYGGGFGVMGLTSRKIEGGDAEHCGSGGIYVSTLTPFEDVGWWIDASRR